MANDWGFMANDWKIAALTLLFVTVVACVHPSDEGAQTTAQQTTSPTTTPAAAPAAAGPDVRLPLLPPSNLGPAAGAMGTLEVDGPCLYLRARNGMRTLPLFATFDTRWNRSAGTLEVGTRTFRAGDAVLLGGAPSEGLPKGVTWVQAPDPKCNTERTFIAHSVDVDRK